MKIYLDVCCLNRPFDDQRQPRVRSEADAVVQILRYCEIGVWQLVTSTAVFAEIAATRDVVRRDRVLQLLSKNLNSFELSESTFHRADELTRLGLRFVDALHVAAAEECADIFLTCDDRLLLAALRHQSEMRVHTGNPLSWMQNNGAGTDA